MLNFFFEEVSLGAQQNNPPVCFQRFHIHCWRSQTSFCTLCLKTGLPAKYAKPLKQDQPEFRFRVYWHQRIALCTVQTKSKYSIIISCIGYMYYFSYNVWVTGCIYKMNEISSPHTLVAMRYKHIGTQI